MEIKKKTWKLHGRKKPYTEIGIGRLPCFRCGAPAETQWQICADGNLFRPICWKCDTALNEAVLKFMGDPSWKEKIIQYKTETPINATPTTARPITDPPKNAMSKPFFVLIVHP